mmetsp:Transcript_64059/g.101963  ORF Transcript_64059/g.101963 Transcript_64059/m.101963 type:complete len:257 (-) Transcript_64059:561-1331(-)
MHRILPMGITVAIAEPATLHQNRKESNHAITVHTFGLMPFFHNLPMARHELTHLKASLFLRADQTHGDGIGPSCLMLGHIDGTGFHLHSTGDTDAELRGSAREKRNAGLQWGFLGSQAIDAKVARVQAARILFEPPEEAILSVPAWHGQFQDGAVLACEDIDLSILQVYKKDLGSVEGHAKDHLVCQDRLLHVWNSVFQHGCKVLRDVFSCFKWKEDVANLMIIALIATKEPMRPFITVRQGWQASYHRSHLRIQW